jgi:hypothetical protein
MVQPCAAIAEALRPAISYLVDRKSFVTPVMIARSELTKGFAALGTTEMIGGTYTRNFSEGILSVEVCLHL